MVCDPGKSLPAFSCIILQPNLLQVWKLQHEVKNQHRTPNANSKQDPGSSAADVAAARIVAAAVTKAICTDEATSRCVIAVSMKLTANTSWEHPMSVLHGIIYM